MSFLVLGFFVGFALGRRVGRDDVEIERANREMGPEWIRRMYEPDGKGSRD